MIKEILEKVHLHKSRAAMAYNELKTFQNQLNAGVFEDFEKVKIIDTFIYRFIKLQDMMGEKLFRIFLDTIGEYKDSMSLLDVLDKLEKLQVVEDTGRWMYYRNLRNKLTHEYPTNEEEIIEGIVLAMDAFLEIEAILSQIEKYIVTKRVDLV